MSVVVTDRLFSERRLAAGSRSAHAASARQRQVRFREKLAHLSSQNPRIGKPIVRPVGQGTLDCQSRRQHSIASAVVKRPFWPLWITSEYGLPFRLASNGREWRRSADIADMTVRR